MGDAAFTQGFADGVVCEGRTVAVPAEVRQQNRMQARRNHIAQ